MYPLSRSSRTARTIAVGSVAIGGLFVAQTLGIRGAIGDDVTPVDRGTEVAQPADAMHPALRMRLPNLLFFPMQIAPRCEILDNFGEGRSGGRVHQGSDMLSTLGQEVYAVADGYISDKVVVGEPGSSLSGNLLDVTTTTARYAYAHLSGFAPGIEVGTEVSFGQLIGYVGDTGNPGKGNYHLHFELHPLNGAAVDPLPLLAIPNGCKVF